MTENPRVVDLLQQILITLKVIASAPKAAPAPTPEGLASDDDLDSKFGDPELRFTPRDWTGPTFKHAKFSQCPPALLDMVATSLEYFADKHEKTGEKASNGKPRAPYERKDAARARGWAARMRAGTHPTPGTTAEAEPAIDWDSNSFN